MRTVDSSPVRTSDAIIRVWFRTPVWHKFVHEFSNHQPVIQALSLVNYWTSGGPRSERLDGFCFPQVKHMLPEQRLVIIFNHNYKMLSVAKFQRA